MAHEHIDLEKMGQAGRTASRKLATLTTTQKNAALFAIAKQLEGQAAVILAQNAQDIEDGRAKGLRNALLDRLLRAKRQARDRMEKDKEK